MQWNKTTDGSKENAYAHNNLKKTRTRNNSCIISSKRARSCIQAMNSSSGFGYSYWTDLLVRRKDEQKETHSKKERYNYLDVMTDRQTDRLTNCSKDKDVDREKEKNNFPGPFFTG